nr:CHAT domain-containing protein [Actinomadura rayongensis]
MASLDPPTDGREGDRALAARRRAAASEWDALLSRIRARDGLTDFLAPPSINALLHQTGPGPIILVTADHDRGDALILTTPGADTTATDAGDRSGASAGTAPDANTGASAGLSADAASGARTSSGAGTGRGAGTGFGASAGPSADAGSGAGGGRVRHVPLPGLTDAAVRAYGDRFLAARRVALGGRDGRARAEDELHDVLGWLWDTVAAPVLDALGYTGVPRGAWPRVWWCPVGVLAYLPLHAAGHHHDLVADVPPRTVMDRVVSSYTPTIRALAYARRETERENGSALIVAMPETPDMAPLPGADAEAHRVAGLLADPTVLRTRAATRKAVLKALPDHSVVHFACHTATDWDDPGANRLLLHDHAVRPLTVAEISRQRLTGADLAYLSACGTSDTHPRLVDEAVHITAAFQLAGYRTTIGTLWPLSDRVATQVAEEVYAALTDGGARPPDTACAALALHHALRRVRAAFLDAPTLWAGQIHAGA